MNKTQQRAIQKHRASAKRFALKRKAEGAQQGTARGRTGAAGATTAARPRTATKRRGEDATESE